MSVLEWVLTAVGLGVAFWWGWLAGRRDRRREKPRQDNTAAHDFGGGHERDIAGD